LPRIARRKLPIAFAKEQEVTVLEAAAPGRDQLIVEATKLDVSAIKHGGDVAFEQGKAAVEHIAGSQPWSVNGPGGVLVVPHGG
jgi:hypothetical protein